MATQRTPSAKQATSKPSATRARAASKTASKTADKAESKASAKSADTSSKKPRARPTAPAAGKQPSAAAQGQHTSPQPTDAVDQQLARYRSMRDFSVTAEPSGGSPPTAATALPFCIQKHAASHLHYDFRLGWNGVLKSWACAKGPSYVVGDKRLAVEVEDHPMEYGGFEGIIPHGQYGGGNVMLWDQGTWEPQPGYTDVAASLRDGHLKFLMYGTKMHGKWALIRMSSHAGVSGKSGAGRWRDNGKPNWLLIKEHDEFEQPANAPAITETANRSVVTDRTMEQIAAQQDHVWNSRETAGTGQAWYSQPTKVVPAAAAKVQRKPQAGNKLQADSPARASSGDDLASALAGLPKEVQPAFLKPQLAEEATEPPEGAGWLHELKLDGYRMQARKHGSTVRMLTRSGLDWTHRVRAVAEEVARLPEPDLTLDGEVVVLAQDGTTNFADLQASFQEGARHPLTFFVFDLLHAGGRNPRGLPLRERKRLLGQILASADPATLQLSEHLETSGGEMFRKACELHAEGIVSKQAAAPYREGRSTQWLKSKCLHEQEFVVVGWTLPGKSKAGGPGIGSLLLGYYTDAGRLIYAGRAGTGFNARTSAALRKRLEPLTQPDCPVLGPNGESRPSAEARRDAQWVVPELVAQVRFATWTADNQLRQAAFLGLREDKAAQEVRREAPTAAPTPKRKKSASATPAKKSTKPAKALPELFLPAPEPLTHPPVRLTHPDKVLDNETRLTKQQLADFYWAVAKRMLPHVADRPLSLVRCPEGSEKACFYQKHVNHMLPPGVTSVEVPDKKTGVPEPYITLSTPEALAGLAQMGVLEVHPWGSRNDDLERPDRLTIDLDPDEALPWSTLVEAALEVRAALQHLGLKSWVKTTGGKGLHVVFPIEPDLEWPRIKQWAHGFVTLLEQANPQRYLTRMTKAARTGRIYLDYLRNERGATAVAPYSPRARRGAGVAVPLAWEELATPTRPIFQVANFAAWGGRLTTRAADDPWHSMATTRQRISPEAQAAAGLK